MPMLLGVETEYAVNGVADTGVTVDKSSLVSWLISVARESCPHLRDGGSGLFLANGARLYVDRGSHPEYATPECADPWTAVSYVRAGEATLLELAAEVVRRTRGLREFTIYRSNVDYTRSGATWGCHESYLHGGNPLALHPQLIPHLVTRILYAGAGGFVPNAPGTEFTLSPRAWMLSQVASPDSTSERGIVHLKDESLARPGWHRLHLICGESLCSDTAAVLKLGTTALIVAAVEAGRRPGNPVRLADPVRAVRVVAADPDGGAELQLSEGGRLTALEIQRHYLAEVEACNPERLPVWAAEICRLWRTTLDALETRSASVQHTFDWAIKRALYERWITARMSLAAFRRAGEVMTRLERINRTLDPEEAGGDIPERLDGEHALRRKLDRLRPMLLGEGVTATELQEYVRLRHELLETDTRFGQLGAQGVFERLDSSAVLRHRTTPSVQRPEARERPPRDTRARIRGEWIGRLWSEAAAGRYRGDWTGLWEETTGRMLDLSDPFVATAEWR